MVLIILYWIGTQSISCDVHGISGIVSSKYISLKVLLPPFTKVLGQKDQLEKDFLHKGCLRFFFFFLEIVKNRPTNFFFVGGAFSNHSAVHSGQVSKRRICGCACFC